MIKKYAFYEPKRFLVKQVRKQLVAPLSCATFYCLGLAKEKETMKVPLTNTKLGFRNILMSASFLLVILYINFREHFYCSLSSNSLHMYSAKKFMYFNIK